MSDARNHPATPDDAENDDAAPDAALDALLATARWPEPPADSQRRLREAWAQLGGRRRTAPWYLGAVAAAAAVVLVATAVWRAAVREGGRTDVATHETGNDVITPAVATTRAVTKPAAVAVTWRPPTPWELALVAPRGQTATPGVPTQSVRATAGGSPSLNDRVAAAVDAVVQDPEGVAAIANRFTPHDRPRVERRLSQDVLSAGSESRRAAAVKLLSRLGTPRSAPLLASLAGEPGLRRDALDGLERVGDVPTLTALASGTHDEQERRRLLAALLRREPAHAVPVFLAFLQDGATEATALAALGDVERPPVDAMFARLNDPRAATRLAAARALGRIDGPDVTARLAWMLRNNVNRREALLALASSEGAEARRLFEWALESKELGSAARAARQSL